MRNIIPDNILNQKTWKQLVSIGSFKTFSYYQTREKLECFLLNYRTTVPKRKLIFNCKDYCRLSIHLCNLKIKRVENNSPKEGTSSWFSDTSKNSVFPLTLGGGLARSADSSVVVGASNMMLDGRLGWENIVTSITVPSEVVASVDNICLVRTALK